MNHIVETPETSEFPEAVCIGSGKTETATPSSKGVAEALYDLSSLISLMALNASVEAARAGKDEKAVADLVADIKELALRTTRVASQLADAPKC